MSILDEILAHKRVELVERKKRVPEEKLRDAAARAAGGRPQNGSFRKALASRNRPLNIIAEIKKASPSRGVIREDFDPVSIARAYAANGAAALSVLTDERYFQGRLEYLLLASAAVSCPALRKDFIIDPYQILEARAAGASAVLLIVAALDAPALERLLAEARRQDLDALVEVHEACEVAPALAAGAEIIGVNNRNLKTFEVDVETTVRLRDLVPPECVLVSESGIDSRAQMERLREKGVDAFLVGEALMRAPDIGARLREFTA